MLKRLCLNSAGVYNTTSSHYPKCYTHNASNRDESFTLLIIRENKLLGYFLPADNHSPIVQIDA